LKHVVIVGSGTGGTFAANLLAKQLRSRIKRGEVSIELVGESDEHVFQPANLDVALKGKRPERYVKRESRLLNPLVKFYPEAAEKIDLGDRRVYTKTGRSLGYDYLLVATGAVADPSMTPGLEEGSLNFHTGPFNAARIWEKLKGFSGGKVVVAVAGVPYKCPPSPNEAAFLLDEHFRKRGIRERVEIKLLTPYPRAYPAEAISEVIEPLYERLGIEVVTFFSMDSVDPKKKVVYSLDGEEYEYDLLLAIPPHRGADVIIRSEVGDEEGWIPTDKHTLFIKDYDDALAIGDATNIPISKSGVVAHLESGVAVLNILSGIEGYGEVFRYNGRINCPMELGYGRAIFVSATYDKPPEPQKPSRIKAIMKSTFSRIYWKALSGDLEWIFKLFLGECASPTNGGKTVTLAPAR